MEKQKPYIAMILIQLIYAGMALLSKVAIDGGMNNFVFVFYRQAIATGFLAPFALVLERKSAPPLSFMVFCKIFLISLCGITLSLDLYYAALDYTSATVAAASTNSIPVITFFLAVLLRLEVVNLRSYSGKAKAVGVVVCMAGVVTMAIYIGPSLAFLSHSIHRHSKETINRNGLNNHSSKNWMKGSFLMLSANATWSLWIVMQAGALKAYPSKLLLTTLQCFFSTVQTAIVALAFERKPSKWKLGLDLQLLSVAYCGIVVTGITFWLRVWCIEKKGAVFTTLFTPLSLLITVVFSTLLLGETITLGSVVGQAFLIGGLYGVQWGKYQDQMDTKPVDEHEDKYSDMKEML